MEKAEWTFRDLIKNLRGALAPVVTTHHAAITKPRRVGEILRALHSYRGLPVTEAALKLAPLVFVRTMGSRPTM
jgi:hypothetical protein